jgi:glycyl-tRNA synthetase beta chain
LVTALFLALYLSKIHMTEFLLELYSEEIPARMQEAAAKEIASKIAADAKYFYTPQRIVVLADLPDMQPDVEIERKGPPLGAAEVAINGFLKAVGLDSIDKASTIEEKGRTFYYYKNTVKGKPTAYYLAELLPKTLSEFTWPKSMRWGSGDTRWVRPLHSIIAIFGGKVVPFKFGEVTSGNTTQGHRFLDSSKLQIASFKEYKDGLAQRKAIIDPSERKQIIWDAAKKAAGSFELKEDERLLAEVANLVEYPVVLVGTFDKAFLDVPQECLIATMKANQKYFPLFENGKLTNKFIITSNMIAEDGGKRIIAGNERVIKARLSDAKFFWEQDQKQSLESYLPKLEQVTFHAKVGTLHAKALRIAHLAKYIANIIGADSAKAERAGLLCKADLVSGMVGEFAELQGIMGGYYAAKHEAPEIAAAIKEHYQPAGQDDDVPTAPVSVCVALADKIDSLVQLWQAGEKPTGSRDPLGLRRAGLGIIRLILANNLKISLKSLIIAASKQGEAGTDEIFEFFIERMKHLLKAQNIRHDYVAAVLDGKTDNLLAIRTKALALTNFLGTESGSNLLESYRRAANILAIEEKKDKTTYPPEIKEKLLDAKEENELYDQICTLEPKILNALKTENYEGAMAEFARLQPYVKAFFDNVIVNAENAQVRQNRLCLLARIREFMDLNANFGKIES